LHAVRHDEVRAADAARHQTGQEVGATDAPLARRAQLPLGRTDERRVHPSFRAPLRALPSGAGEHQDTQACRTGAPAQADSRPVTI